MTTINRYITREILGKLAIVLVTIIGIYLIVDFFEKIDNFVESDLSVGLAISFLALKTPLIVSQTSPVGLFLSVIIAFGFMKKNNEILAIRSGGISAYTLLKPVFAIGVVFSLCLFFFSEIVVPISTAKSNRIWLEDVKKSSLIISKEKNIWIRGERSIFHIKYYNPKSEAVYGVSLHFFDGEFSLIRRVDAEKGAYVDGKWVLENVMEQVLNPRTGEYITAFFDEREKVFDFAPEELRRVAKKSEEMNFTELGDYIRKIEMEGYDASSYKVDFHAKLAFPFVCVFLCLAGAGISLRTKGAEGVGKGVAFGIGVAFVYWIFYSFCLSLGYGEMLPPILAAWTANVAFVCFTAITLINAD